MTETVPKFDQQAAISHVRTVIAETELIVDPYPHVNIVGLLPDHVFNMLLEMWPGEAHFSSTNWARRLELKFNQLVDSTEGAALEFWIALNELLAVANQALREKFAPHMAIKFEPFFGAEWRNRVGDVKYVQSKFQLAVYSGEYDLPPHVDSLRLVTNAFLYVSDRDAVEPELGTVIYRSRGLMIPSNWPLLESTVSPYLERAGVSPYARNCCFAYLNTPISFHGVDARDIGKRRRRLLMFGNLMFVREMERVFGPVISKAAFRG